MRRDVCRHANGDAASAVNQEIWKARRQNERLAGRTVIVVLEIDRFLVDVLKQRSGSFRHANFGVAHRSGRIAVHRPEIPLPVEQRQPHREVLRHPHHGVVDRLVTMRVVFTHDVANDAGGLAVGLVKVEPAFVHRMQDASMHRLQAVTGIWQRTADDHAHRIVEVGAFHLLLDRHRCNPCGWLQWRRGRRWWQIVFDGHGAGFLQRRIAGRALVGQRAPTTRYGIRGMQNGRGNRGHQGS